MFYFLRCLGIISDTVYIPMGVKMSLVDSARNMISGALDAKQVERLEKDLAQAKALVAELEAKVAELEAKIPPNDLIDAGGFFLKKLADGSIDKFPYCYLCKSPMNPIHRKTDPLGIGGSRLYSFKCANIGKCNFELDANIVVPIIERHIGPSLRP